MNIDTKDWDLRNVWVSPSGEWVCRPACVEINPGLTGIVAAHSIRDPKTQEVWHYFVDSGSLIIKDENFTTIASHVLGTSQTPRVVTFAVLGDEVVISSPDFATRWGLVGNAVVEAEKVDSVNTARTAIDVPRGICVAWAGRIVISDGEAVYFSDGLAPRTFVGNNIIDPPGGVVYGMHVSAGGALILVTADGVWALPEDAAAAGQIVLGIWSKLTDYEAQDFATSCESHGVIFGLTPGGYRRIDQIGATEITLSEKPVTRSDTVVAGIGRIHFDDFRTAGKMYRGQYGPIVAGYGAYAHFTSIADNLESWWDLPDGPLVGVLFDHDGTEMYVLSDSILRPNGEDDGDDVFYASLTGRVPFPPEANPVLRSVTLATDGEEPIKVALHGTTKSQNVSAVTPVVGTDTWGALNYYREPPMVNRRFLWASRGQEAAVHIIIGLYLAKIPKQVAFEFKGAGKGRPIG